MTKIKSNSLLKGISGIFGDTHVYRKINGKMYMVAPPAVGSPVTGERLKRKEAFLSASEWAKQQLEDPLKKEKYQARVTATHRSAYFVALADFLRKPKVTEIDIIDYYGRVGDPIKVIARDDFEVARVKVDIHSATGVLLETGEAVQDAENKHVWRYTATAKNEPLKGSRIEAVAYDRPDHHGSLKLEL